MRHPKQEPLALVVQPDPRCGPGLVGHRLAERGYALDVRAIVPPDPFASPDVTWQPPDPREFDVVVVLGARWSVHDGPITTWLGDLLNLLRTAHTADTPVLGICFGAQALSCALGGTVRRAPQPEIGWVSIDTDEPELVGHGPWFQWHSDEFIPPPGSVEFARNAVASQAFHSGRAWGLQFHPELTNEILTGWLDDDGVRQARGSGIDVDRLRKTTTAQMPSARVRANALVDGFLTLVSA